MRNFAIICVNDGIDIDENIVKRLPKGENVTIFMPEAWKDGEIAQNLEKNAHECIIKTVFYPDELKIHATKCKNFVTSWFFTKGTSGFLHVIEDPVQILAPADDFLREIELMMTKFHLKYWFNTICDQCNYVYRKYNPRLNMLIDEDEAKKAYDKKIAWCSNANTAWVCFNLDTASFEDVKFEERFRFPMFYILEFLARHRNTKKQHEMYYMNYYPSVDEERGVFQWVQPPNEFQLDQEAIKAEDRLFREELKVDSRSDYQVQILFGDLRHNLVGEPK